MRYQPSRQNFRDTLLSMKVAANASTQDFALEKDVLQRNFDHRCSTGHMPRNALHVSTVQQLQLRIKVIGFEPQCLVNGIANGRAVMARQIKRRYSAGTLRGHRRIVLQSLQ